MDSGHPLGLELHAEEVVSLGRAAVEVVRSLGLTFSHGNRLDSSLRLIRESMESDEHTVRAIVDAQQSVIESFIIGRVAVDSRDSELTQKLRSLLRGKPQIRHDRYSQPRDEQFETLIWALLKLSRMGPVVVGEPDFLVLGPGGPLGVAVKRLGTEDSLERNVLKGSKQISGSTALRGMLAINVDMPYRERAEDFEQYVSSIPPLVQEVLEAKDPGHGVELILVVGARGDIADTGFPVLSYEFSVRVLPVPEPEGALIARRLSEIGRRVEEQVAKMIREGIDENRRAGA